MCPQLFVNRCPAKIAASGGPYGGSTNPYANQSTASAPRPAETAPCQNADSDHHSDMELKRPSEYTEALRPSTENRVSKPRGRNSSCGKEDAPTIKCRITTPGNKQRSSARLPESVDVLEWKYAMFDIYAMMLGWLGGDVQYAALRVCPVQCGSPQVPPTCWHFEARNLSTSLAPVSSVGAVTPVSAAACMEARTGFFQEARNNHATG